MRLLELDESGDVSLTEYADNFVPPYAILSHTWGTDEVTFDDVVHRRGLGKAGYQKIRFCAERAKQDGIQYVWVDTCCIDKTSPAEVSESINAMYRWYCQAERCYAYLSDVSTHKHHQHDDTRETSVHMQQTWEPSFRASRWFTRGWTLQELLAPASVEFFSRKKQLLGSKVSLASLIQDITTIPGEALRSTNLSDFSIQERLRWAAMRTTKKPEDRAYCLLGIFNVLMLPRYGEGEHHAMERLARVICKQYDIQPQDFESLSIMQDTSAPQNDHSQPQNSIGGDVSSSSRIDELLNLLRFGQMDSRRHTVRPARVSACAWLLQTRQYRDWLNPKKFDEHCGFLWIMGKPGVGKSTLVKFAYTQARRSAADGEITISYFFHARGDMLEKSTLGMYRSLLSQLLHNAGDLEAVFDDIPSSALQASEFTWTIERLRELLTSAIRAAGSCRIRCFIDALDECNEEEIRDMITHFEDLGQISRGRFYVCFASRHYPVINIRNGIKLVLEDQSGHDDDLINYVRSRLLIGKGKIQEDIITQIVHKGNGMFLWAVLVVGILNDESRRGRISDVQRRLNEIPAISSDLFRYMLGRDGRNREGLLLCIQWILFSRRSLKLEEIYFAITAGLGRGPDAVTEWDSGVISKDVMRRFVYDCSKGLAEFTPLNNSGGISRDLSVQFMHESVSDFLLRAGGLHDLWPELRADPRSLSHRQLCKCCQKYLTLDLEGFIVSTKALFAAFPNNEAQLQNTLKRKFPFLTYASEHIFYHANEAAKGENEDGFLLEFDVKNWIAVTNFLEKRKVRRHTENATLLYLLAEQNCAHLIRRFFKLKLSVPSTSQERYQCPFAVALAYHNWDAVHALIEPLNGSQAGQIVEELRMHHNTPIEGSTKAYVWALHNGHDRFAESLATFAFTDTRITDEEWRTAYLIATEESYTGVIRHLENHVGVSGKASAQTSSVTGTQTTSNQFSIFDVTADFKSTLDRILPTTEPTSRDTGSVSEGKIAAHEDAPDADQRSVADTLNLGEDVNAEVSSFIAETLLDSLRREDVGRIQSSQSYETSVWRLLQSVAPMLCLPEHGSVGLDSARFIWRHCRAIAQELVDMIGDKVKEERPLAGIPKLPEYSPGERTAGWLDSILAPTTDNVSFISPNDIGPDYNAAPEDTLETSQDNVDLVPPELPVIKQVIVSSNAWRWLVGRLIGANRLTPWKSDTMTMICASLPRLTNESGIVKQAVTYRLNWDPVAFFEEEFSQSSARLQDIITITTCSDQYYACTCGDYVRMVWPSLATQLLDVLQMAIENGRGPARTYTLKADSTVALQIQSGYTIVTATGSLTTVMEIGEQLSWLGAAFTTSPYPDQTCKRIARFETHSSSTSGPLDLQISYDVELLIADDGQSCWRKFFRSTSIASNFPIPIRADGMHGLETNLELMILLGEASWATVFNDKFMLKGFSSVLYPVKQSTDCLIWHFAHAQNWRYLPFTAGCASCLDQLALAGGDLSWLETFRHFVAWTADAEVHTGTLHADYNIGEPDPNKFFSDISLENISISASKYISIGATLSRGRNSIPLWSAPYSEYLRDIVQASQECVLLYDAEESRAWLVDAASALLHITVAQLRVSPEARYWNKDVIEQLKYPQPQGSGSCLDALLDEGNRRLVLLQDDIGHEKDNQHGDLEKRTHLYRFQHLVHDNWKKLAQILEQHALKLAAIELRLTTRDRLVGWSFRSLVNSKALLRPTISYLTSESTGNGWLPLVQSIDAAVLIGHGFGDLIRPSNTAAQEMCSAWSTMPTQRDFLAVTICLLGKIAESRGCRFPGRLARDVWWVQRGNPFLPCNHSHDEGDSKCNFAQFLSSKSGGEEHHSTHFEKFDCEKAAVIFANGHASRWNGMFKRFKSDTKNHLSVPLKRDTQELSGKQRLSSHSSRKSVAVRSRSPSTNETLSNQDIDSSRTPATSLDDGNSDVQMTDLEAPVFRSFVYGPDRPSHPAAWPESEASAKYPLITDAKQAVTSISSAVHSIPPHNPPLAQTEDFAAKNVVHDTLPGQGNDSRPLLRRKRRFSASTIDCTGSKNQER